MGQPFFFIKNGRKRDNGERRKKNRVLLDWKYRKTAGAVKGSEKASTGGTATASTYLDHFHPERRSRGGGTNSTETGGEVSQKMMRKENI